jgi:hypothetical protein
VSLRDRLEPEAITHVTRDFLTKAEMAEVAPVSIAVSLKRIADALDRAYPAPLVISPEAWEKMKAENPEAWAALQEAVAKVRDLQR